MTALIEVRVADLVGPALDWAVAQVQITEGEFTADSEEHSTGRPYFTCKFARPSLWGEGREQKGTINQETGGPWVMHGPGGTYSPSTDWSQGGPLIDKFNVSASCSVDERIKFATIYKRLDCVRIAYQSADTRLIAVCRAIAQLKFGDTVNVPADLVQAVQP